MKEKQQNDSKKEKIEKLVIVAKQMNSIQVQRATDIARGMLLASQSEKRD